jgi:hypothetical protein
MDISGFMLTQTSEFSLYSYGTTSNRSFTLENSFHGYYHGEKFKEISSNDFIKLGADIISSVYKY